MKSFELKEKLDIMIPNAVCELIYEKDYELVIAVMLSAQCTDKRVNMVTKDLFKKYDLKAFSEADLFSLEKEIYSLGSYTKKAYYIKEIAKSLLENYDGKVPNNREYLESLPGVGHKTANCILAELYNVPTIAVDTHVLRVSKRLGLAKENDDVKVVEKKLMKFFAKEDWNRVNHQILLLGRYTCLAKKPQCDKCLINCPNKKY